MCCCQIYSALKNINFHSLIYPFKREQNGHRVNIAFKMKGSVAVFWPLCLGL